MLRLRTYHESMSYALYPGRPLPLVRGLAVGRLFMAQAGFKALGEPKKRTAKAVTYEGGVGATYTLVLHLNAAGQVALVELDYGL